MRNSSLDSGAFVAAEKATMGRLNGQVAMITGGSRGIGRAVALEFAREGAHLALIAGRDREALRNVEAEIAALGRESIGRVANVARREEIDQVVDAVLVKWGRVDVLVNNAGILQLGPLETISEERWDTTLGVHLKGTFNCTQAVIPVMKKRGRGKIINIAAPSALRGSYGVADYAAAKGGIVAFSRNAANELKSYNIQVNCISPVADTRMTEELTRFRREQQGIARRDREIVAPEKIAPAFLFFATADSDYVTGQLIEVGRI